MLLGIIDNYFSPSDEERIIYRVGRRSGIYGRLADLANKSMYNRERVLLIVIIRRTRINRTMIY